MTSMHVYIVAAKEPNAVGEHASVWRVMSCPLAPGPLKLYNEQQMLVDDTSGLPGWNPGATLNIGRNGDVQLDFTLNCGLE